MYTSLFIITNGDNVTQEENIGINRFLLLKIIRSTETI